MPLTGESDIGVLPIGDYVVPVTTPTVRHCVDCITNPIKPEAPKATERSIRCIPCEFKHKRRLNGAKRAKWKGNVWPDDDINAQMANVRKGKRR